MSRFIELRTGKSITDRYTTELINCNIIRRVSDRRGYSEPMITVTIDSGTRGHYSSPGANSIFTNLECYEVYAEVVKRLTER